MRIRWRFVLPGLLVFCLVTCHSITRAQNSTESLARDHPEAKYALDGIVINSVSGEPIPRALVQVDSKPPHKVLTDANGQFHFEDLTPGKIRISARKPGFFDVPHPGYYMDTTVTIAADTQPLTLDLIPENVIRGHVQSRAGKPIAALPVKVMVVRIADGKKQIELAGTGKTDASGHFRVADLYPGSYYVEAGPGFHGRHAGYSTVFYPHTHDLSSATLFELTPGQTLDVDFSLEEEPAFQLAGSVKCLGPHDGIQTLRLLDRLGKDLSVPITIGPEPCQFHGEIFAGFVRLIGNIWHGGTPFSIESTLNLDSDMIGLSLAPSPMQSIPVLLRTESAYSSATQGSDMKVSNAHISLLLSADYGRLTGPNHVSHLEADASDPSVILKIASGRYSVEIDATEPWYVQSAQCGDTDLLRDDLTLIAGVQPSPIEIVVRDDGATVSGKVDVGDGVQPTTVVFVPDSGHASQAKTVTANDIGDFVIKGLAPGSYNVLAFDPMDGLEYTDPDGLNQFLSKATRITLQPNEEHKIMIQLTKIPPN